MNLDEASKQLVAADALVITAGAGMGVDSGLPDFRGKQGFWNAYPAAQSLNLDFHELATPSWFRRNPQLAWAFYGHRLSTYRDTVPHTGFEQLLEIANDKPAGYFVFTSNVDGQFQKAGFDKQRIVECHGSIHYLQCSDSCWDAIWPATSTRLSVDTATFEVRGELPICSRCGSVARPNIVMFDDNDWLDERYNEQIMRMYDWWRFVVDEGMSVIVLEIGAGTAVPTVRNKSEALIAAYENARLTRLNPRENQVPEGHFGMNTTAKSGIDILLGGIVEKWSSVPFLLPQRETTAMRFNLGDKYILIDRRPVRAANTQQWIDWFSSSEEQRTVASTETHGTRVSTIFLGLAPATGTPGTPPLLFETCVFGGQLNLERRRSATWKEADINHQLMVEAVRQHRPVVATLPKRKKPA